MSSASNFCSNCGEKLDENTKVDECPKCHSALHEHDTHIKPSRPVVEHLPYKSPGTTALIAFLGGIFALPGIGHMYIGKVRKGILILIGGLILYVLAIVPIVMAVSFQELLSSQNSVTSDITTDISSVWIQILALMLIFSIAYIVLFIWQIFNARNLAKKFNESVRTTGKEPW